MSTTATKTIVEGAAKISLPPGQVFYNPVQIFNRDLSVCCINTFTKNYQKSDKILFEGLSATGLRSIRYAKECPDLTKIIANDIESSASLLINENIISNSCQDKVVANCGDANFYLYQSIANGQKFDIIDLDPYGSAVPFLDSAIQGINDDGLLCVTCTDMAILCASYTDTCYNKYGSIPFKGDICHEFAVRIILNTIERTASKYKKTIEPLMSCAIDFYARVFVRVRHSAKLSKYSGLKSGMVLRCPDCKYFEIQPVCRNLGKGGESFKIGPAPIVASNRCKFCAGNVQIGGPIWIGEMHEKNFLEHLINSSFPDSISTGDRMKGLAAVCLEETSLSPLYYSLSEVAHVLKAPTPPMNKVMYSIKNAGFNLCISHCVPSGLKSDAPFEFLIAVFKQYIQDDCPNYKFATGDDIRGRIWENLESLMGKYSVSFQKNEAAIPVSKLSNFVRFPMNPEKNWGPKPRARPAKQARTESNNN